MRITHLRPFWFILLCWDNPNTALKRGNSTCNLRNETNTTKRKRNLTEIKRNLKTKKTRSDEKYQNWYKKKTNTKTIKKSE